MPFVPQPDVDFDGLYKELTDRILGCAIKVHKTLGPGFLESVYENALAIEFQACKIPFGRQITIDLLYEGQAVGVHRLDMLVDDKVIVELKAKEQICQADKATTLSYLKATEKQVALILNFGRPTLEIKRLGNKERIP